MKKIKRREESWEEKIGGERGKFGFNYVYCSTSCTKLQSENNINSSAAGMLGNNP